MITSGYDGKPVPDSSICPQEKAKNRKKQTSTPRLWPMPTYIPKDQSYLPPENIEDSGYSTVSFSSDGSNESFTQSDSNVDTYMGSGYDSY